jgi:ectoine hydroxylase-related dioxygenase (phytanoyl-CoA dioxygenase family)
MSAQTSDSLEHGLTSEQIDHYRAKGYLVVPGRFPSEQVGAWRDECDRVWRLPGLIVADDPRVMPRDRVDGNGVELERIDWFIENSPLFRRIVDDPRVRGPVSCTLGDEPVLFKDKLLVRSPGTVGYGLHQDYLTWQSSGLAADEVLTVLLAFDAIGVDNGALEVFAGQHQRIMPAPPDEPLDTAESAVDPTRAEIIEVDAGDMIMATSIYSMLTRRRSVR